MSDPKHPGLSLVSRTAEDPSTISRYSGSQDRHYPDDNNATTRRAARSVDRCVGIVIVNYNAGSCLLSAVAAALRSSAVGEVVVVDNASADGSVDRLLSTYGFHPRLRVVRNSKNMGFARAANLALCNIDLPLILLLNPDCIIESSTLDRLLPLLERDTEVGMIGCLLRNEDGTEQAGCRRAVPTPWRSFVRVLHLDRVFWGYPRFRNFVLIKDPLPSVPIYVEAISGAFMLIRREALKRVGPLDEEYFLHCEDLDWCFRFRVAGWKILFVPDVEVVHYGGVCSASRPIFVHWHKHKGMVRFYRKFFRHQYPSVLMVLVAAAVWFRFVLLILSEPVKIVRRFFKNGSAKKYAERRKQREGRQYWQ